MASNRPLSRDSESLEVRRMFTPEYLLESDWYRERLRTKQRRDIALWRRHLAYLDRFIVQHGRQRTFGAVDVSARRQLAETELARVRSPQYLSELFGTLGADPMEPRGAADDTDGTCRYGRGHVNVFIYRRIDSHAAPVCLHPRWGH